MKKVVGIFFISVLLVSCSKEESAVSQQSTVSENKTVSEKPAISQAEVVPASQADFDFSKIALGGKLYKQNCAECHGASAEGTPDWRKRKPDGKLKPPPLNGSGHAWHHSKKLLLSIIAKGSIDKGGDMPSWEGKLSRQEMDAILTWIQSKWPEEIYTNWLEINKR